jgi:NitT/TauT family transport system permease protein
MSLESPRRRRRLLPSRGTVGVVAGPLVLFVLLTAAWQAGVWNRLFGLETFTLPAPSDIVTAIRANAGPFWTDLGITMAPAALGYVVGNGIGLVLGTVLSVLPRRLAGRLSTVLGAAQATPLLAVAPLISLFLGSGLAFRTTVIALVCFPSMVVYAYKGLISVEDRSLKLLASYDASPFQVFRHLRFPTSLPFVFTSLRYSTVLALIGAMICEVLKGRIGLGYHIIDSLASFEPAVAWGATAILSALGILWYSLLVLVERLAVPWAAKRRQS